MIERAIFANMAVAAQRQDADQIDKARELLEIVRSEGFSDYRGELTEKEQRELIQQRDDEGFKTLEALGANVIPGFGHKNLRRISRAYATGRFKTVNPSHLTDSELLSLEYMGPRKLDLVRSRFQYIEPEAISEATES